MNWTLKMRAIKVFWRICNNCSKYRLSGKIDTLAICSSIVTHHSFLSILPPNNVDPTCQLTINRIGKFKFPRTDFSYRFSFEHPRKDNILREFT